MKYYVWHADKTSGPISEAQLRKDLENGNYPSSVLLRSESSPDDQWSYATVLFPAECRSSDIRTWQDKLIRMRETSSYWTLRWMLHIAFVCCALALCISAGFVLLSAVVAPVLGLLFIPLILMAGVGLCALVVIWRVCIMLVDIADGVLRSSK